MATDDVERVLDQLVVAIQADDAAIADGTIPRIDEHVDAKGTDRLIEIRSLPS